MSLDKWIKPEKKIGKKKPPIKKKQEQEPKPSEEHEQTLEEEEIPKSSSSKIPRYILKCTNMSCKFEKILSKKVLNEKDKICQRCKSEMTVKQK